MHINQDKCNEALLYASVKHGEVNQMMKNPIVSYITHPCGVCGEAVSACLNMNEKIDIEKVIILAYLHDTLEDTNATYEEIEKKFGKDIADGVLALTKNEKLPTKLEQASDSISRIKKQPKEVAIVKLADRCFNTRSIVPSWSKEKIELYYKEGMLILNELGGYSKYFKDRLTLKLESYKKQMESIK